jgi:hypothetical protein
MHPLRRLGRRQARPRLHGTVSLVRGGAGRVRAHGHAGPRPAAARVEAARALEGWPMQVRLTAAGRGAGPRRHLETMVVRRRSSRM